jgi:hypothetical protein
MHSATDRSLHNTSANISLVSMKSLDMQAKRPNPAPFNPAYCVHGVNYQRTDTAIVSCDAHHVPA